LCHKAPEEEGCDASERATDERHRARPRSPGRTSLIAAAACSAVAAVRAAVGEELNEFGDAISKLVADRGVSDMMITLADCLQDSIRTGINEDVVREQVRMYAES
jgi:hypothetical protein